MLMTTRRDLGGYYTKINFSYREHHAIQSSYYHVYLEMRKIQYI